MLTRTDRSAVAQGGLPGADAESDAGEAPQRRTHRLRDAVITVVGILGTLTVTWLIVAWMLNLSLVVLATGSMSPTMPAGSVAVVQEVAAADLALGDVVTVPREGSAIPVTHRIVDIAAAADGGERELTLKGDDNDIVDSETYVVGEAKRVVASMPGIGSAVLWVRSPAGIIAATVVVAAIVVWAFWPARTEKDIEPASERGGGKK